MERQVYRLTKRLIEAEQAEMASVGERQRVIWDSDIAGFGCRLSKAGALAFFDYRDANRKKRRLAIGKVLQVELATGKVLKAELTVEQARSKAAVYRVDVRAGADPLGDRRKSGGGGTVREAMRNWITAKTNPKPDRRWPAVTDREY